MVTAQLNSVSAISALFAAGLWLKSALIEMPIWISVNTEIIESAFDNSSGAISSSPDLEKLGRNLKSQSRWSAWAAGFAAVAAASQAIATFPGR